MRRPRGRKTTTWIATLATLVLVAQALLSGLAASAALASVDASGNVICASHGHDSPDHDKGGHRPNCCVMGCTLAAALAPPTSSSQALVVRRELAIASQSPSPDEPRPLERRGLPGIPRAPPLMA